ncbi:hypothetical protein CAP48_07815 [Advenella sp. S44]|nr:hypothetical protein CAP48_07815 [Advenella sp. S44]
MDWLPILLLKVAAADIFKVAALHIERVPYPRVPSRTVAQSRIGNQKPPAGALNGPFILNFM